MVIGAPRSGTAWAANWLTTERTHCIHDPLLNHHWADWDKLAGFEGKRLGVACTGIAVVAPHFVKKHPAKKLVIHRPLKDINASLIERGLSPISSDWDGALCAIPGLHVNFNELFEAPARIWEHLIGRPFDRQRHQALVRLHVELYPPRIKPDPTIWKRLVAEIQGAAA